MPATLNYAAGWTKAEEIEHYTNFIASLPRDSYLRSILAGSEDYVAGEIRNDFARPMAAELRAMQLQAMEAAEELKKTRAQVAEAEQRLREITRAQASAIDSMRDAANNARTAASILSKFTPAK